MKGRFPLAVLLGAALVLTACDGSDIVTPSVESSRNIENDCTNEDDCNGGGGGTGGSGGGGTPTAEVFYGTDVFLRYSGPYKIQAWQSVSQAIANVASSRVSASYYAVARCQSVNRTLVGSQSSPIVYGSPNAVQVTRQFEYPYQDKNGYDVRATHVFTAAAGATGGGTFYSSKYVCF